MAFRWLRGVKPNTGTNQTTDTAAYALFFFYYLRYIMGYQFLDEVVTNGPTRTFNNCHEASGSDGAFAGSTVTFTSGSSPFAATDVGKFLVLVDSTNPENCGIYPIILYNAANSVDIDFYSSAFPTSATGITWYLLDDGSQGSGSVPNTNGDYAVLRANHSSYPWEVKLTHRDGNQAGNIAGAQLEVAAESGAWNTVGDTWNSGVALLTERHWQAKYYQDVHSRCYAVADTEASFLFGFTDLLGRSTKQGTLIALLTPNETRGTRERLIVSGPFPNNGAIQQSTNRSQTYYLGQANVWSEKGDKEVLAYMQGWMEQDTATEYFKQNMGVNARTSQRDSLPIWYTIDPLVYNDYLFGPLGELPPGNVRLAAANIVGEFTTFDSDNWMHWKEGLVVPWNGLNQS